MDKDLALRDLLPKRTRYDYFLIWGHGLENKRDIIDLISEHKDIEILRITDHQTEDIAKLVDAIYSYDYAPVQHLVAKTRYLLNTPNEVTFIFVRNSDAQESYVGQGEYKHVECLRIKEVKEQIRNKFNPRIDGERTEDHVIHASDNELQTDYILKYLGIRDGVGIFRRIRITPYELPYHLPSYTSYTLKRVSMDDIRCNIIFGTKEQPQKRLVKIEDTPHFNSLGSDTSAYSNYLAKFGGGLLNANHSLAGLLELHENLDYPGKLNPKYVIMQQQESGEYVVLDGVHRASVLKSRGEKDLIGLVVQR